MPGRTQVRDGLRRTGPVWKSLLINTSDIELAVRDLDLFAGQPHHPSHGQIIADAGDHDVAAPGSRSAVGVTPVSSNPRSGRWAPCGTGIDRPARIAADVFDWFTLPRLQRAMR